MKIMNDWETKIKLKFPGRLFKRKVGFSFEWQAWLIAYDTLDVEPKEFSERDPDEQIDAASYGAAVWYCIRRRKRIFFTYPNLVKALNKAPIMKTRQLEEAMKYAQYPKWTKATE